MEYFNNNDSLLKSDILMQQKSQHLREQYYNILLLANEYELLSFHYRKIMFRKIINTYNTKKPNIYDEYLLKKPPIMNGFKLDYLMNRQVYLIDILKKIKKISNFNSKSKIGIVKVIGPGEIIDNNLYAYEDTEYILRILGKIKDTFTYYYYYDWDVLNSYNDFIHKYPGKLIDKMKLPTNIKHEHNIVFVNEFSLKKKFKIDNEITSLPFRKFFVSLGLQMLKKGGDLYMEYINVSNTLTFKLLQSIYNLFKSVKFIISSLYDNTLIGGYYIFQDFCGINNINKKKKFIIDFKLLKYINDVQEDIYKKHEFFLKKCNQIKMKKKNNKYYIDYQISIGIDWCNKHNIKINNYYLNNKWENKKDYISYFFPKEKKVIYKNIKIYYDSYYSITLPQEAEQISNLILKYFPNAKIITDACANVGGNTLSFSKYFDNVYSIEIDKERYKCLVNNIKVYNCKNIETFNMSFLDFKKKTDIIFLDPPWGGIFYKLHKKIDLYLNNINIKDIIKKKYVIKIPKNYNLSGLKHYKLIKLKTFDLIIKM